MRPFRPVRSILLSLFCLSLLAAMILDARFVKQNGISGREREAFEVENVAAKQYWEYLRL